MLAWTKLSTLEPRFARFLDILKRIYVDTPFLEALRAAPSYLKFLRELLSKKEEQRVLVSPIWEVGSALLQRGSHEKLQDPGSFSIPCCIGKFQIERALCLGASMSIMLLSICKKLKLPNLCPTTLVIQLADGSIKHPTGVLEDIPIQLDNSVVPCDFVVSDMDESFQAAVILGRLFVATAGAVIDVQAGIISFQLCGERIDFCFPPPTPSILLVIPPKAHVHTVPPYATLGITIFDRDGGSSMWPTCA